MSATTSSTVILTRGDRPEALWTAVASARRAAASLPSGTHDVVIVWNGVDRIAGPNPDVDVADLDVVSPENLGIPGGRNHGLRSCSGDLVLFLDDDAELAEDFDLGAVVDSFDADARLGVVAARLFDEHGSTARRHVPRLGGGSSTRPGPVAQFLGGASVHRRVAFERAGGYAGEFFYSMEETDLALRLVDAGDRIDYEPRFAVFHPATSPTRHAGGIERTARNRVWLAHRNLPMLVAALYVPIWVVLSVVRNRRSRSGMAAVVRGTVDGLRRPLGPRHPIRWRTVLHLTRLGRPPIV